MASHDTAQKVSALLEAVSTPTWRQEREWPGERWRPEVAAQRRQAAAQVSFAIEKLASDLGYRQVLTLRAGKRPVFQLWHSGLDGIFDFQSGWKERRIAEDIKQAEDRRLKALAAQKEAERKVKRSALTSMSDGRNNQENAQRAEGSEVDAEKCVETTPEARQERMRSAIISWRYFSRRLVVLAFQLTSPAAIDAETGRTLSHWSLPIEEKPLNSKTLDKDLVRAYARVYALCKPHSVGPERWLYSSDEGTGSKFSQADALDLLRCAELLLEHIITDKMLARLSQTDPHELHKHDRAVKGGARKHADENEDILQEFDYREEVEMREDETRKALAVIIIVNQHVLWQFMPDSPRQGVNEVVVQELIFEADTCTTDSKEADRIANAIDDLLESFRSQNLTQLQAARIALRLRFPNMEMTRSSQDMLRQNESAFLAALLTYSDVLRTRALSLQRRLVALRSRMQLQVTICGMTLTEIKSKSDGNYDVGDTFKKDCDVEERESRRSTLESRAQETLDEMQSIALESFCKTSPWIMLKTIEHQIVINESSTCSRSGNEAALHPSIKPSIDQLVEVFVTRMWNDSMWIEQMRVSSTTLEYLSSGLQTPAVVEHGCSICSTEAGLNRDIPFPSSENASMQATEETRGKTRLTKVDNDVEKALLSEKVLTSLGCLAVLLRNAVNFEAVDRQHLVCSVEAVLKSLLLSEANSVERKQVLETQSQSLEVDYEIDTGLWMLAYVRAYGVINNLARDDSLMPCLRICGFVDIALVLLARVEVHGVIPSEETKCDITPCTSTPELGEQLLIFIARCMTREGRLLGCVPSCASMDEAHHHQVVSKAIHLHDLPDDYTDRSQDAIVGVFAALRSFGIITTTCGQRKKNLTVQGNFEALSAQVTACGLEVLILLSRELASDVLQLGAADFLIMATHFFQSVPRVVAAAARLCQQLMHVQSTSAQTRAYCAANRYHLLLLEALETHAGDAIMLPLILQTLKSLTFQRPQVRHDLIAQGAVASVCGILHVSSDVVTIIAPCVSLLCNLTCNKAVHSRVNGEMLETRRVCSAVIRALVHHGQTNADVAQFCAWTLVNIIVNGPEENAATEAVLASSIPAVVIHLMEFYMASAEVQVACCALIAVLAHQVPDLVSSEDRGVICPGPLRTMNAAHVVHASLNKHEDNSRLQFYGSLALRELDAETETVHEAADNSGR